MLVSLEAIFLPTFVLICQNRSSVETDHRADLALHIGLPTEHELTHVLHMLDAMRLSFAHHAADAMQQAALHAVQ